MNNKNRDLRFLKLLVEKMVSRPLTVDIAGQKFNLFIEGEYLAIVREGSRKHVETNDRRELFHFVNDNSSYLVTITEDQLYLMLVQDALKAVLLEGGASREDLQSLIGSVAEYEPKESISYLNLLRGTR